MLISSSTVESLAAEAPGDDGQRQILRIAVNGVATARGLTPPWPIDLADDTAARVRKLLLDQDDFADWGPEHLGELRERLLTSATRSAAGAWYTPPPIAHTLTRAALSTITDLHLDDDPGDVLAVSVLDPSCGAGVFLTAAARILANAYVGLLLRTHNPQAITVDTVMADVMKATVYGVDIDPTAVDLAKSACWFQAGGRVPITWLDDNIIVGNPLDGDLPPGLRARLNAPGPLAIVGNPPYKDKAHGAAPWIEARRPEPGQDRAADELLRPSLDEFRIPGQARLEYVLSNLYVYFWRWALWRAFETRLTAAAVAFLSPAAFIGGRGFSGMRKMLREAADLGLVIELTPEGQQPPLNTRIFPGVAQPLCAALFARHAGPDPGTPADVKWAQVTGSRAEKIRRFDRLLSPRGL